jgi:hypothetical protein
VNSLACIVAHALLRRTLARAASRLIATPGVTFPHDLASEKTNVK